LIDCFNKSRSPDRLLFLLYNRGMQNLTEQEAINKDGEEIMNDIEEYEIFENCFLIIFTIILAFVGMKIITWVVYNSVLLVDKYLI